MAGISLADITSTIDSYKRRTGSSLRQLVSDPMEFMRQAIALQMGPSAAAQADPNALLASPGGVVSVGGIPGVMTYHGTPHQFNRYDLSKIGTGEGAQVYGHGMYFAENPSVASSYTNSAWRSATDPRLTEINKRLSAIARERDAITKDAAGVTGDARAPLVKKHSALGDEYDALLKERTDLGNRRGNMYNQDLPDEVLPKMLQWDKLLSEQPESVKAALRKSSFAPDESVWKHYTGAQLYEGEMAARGPYGSAGWPTPEARPGVSRMLAEAGIPGVSYLDQGSRAAGKGTMNHVVWDQDLLDRMSKTLQKVE